MSALGGVATGASGAKPGVLQASIVATAIGDLGIAWTDRGLARVFFPAGPGEREPGLAGRRGERQPTKKAAKNATKKSTGVTASPMRAQLEETGYAVAEAPTGVGARWAERITSHLSGMDVTFEDLPLDLAGCSPFALRVYEAAIRIPRGTTATYAQVAAMIGTRSPRAVGVALGRNPVGIVVPCHRVVGSDSWGGFSAPGGATTKATLLTIEGGALGDPEHRGARKHLARADRELAPLVRRIPCTLRTLPSGGFFRTLVRAIAGQQLSTKAAATIFARLEATIAPARGNGGASTPAPSTPPSHVEVWGNDAPARLLATPTEALRAAGMSGAKSAALHDLARHVVEGKLDLDRLTRAPDDAVVKALTHVRGIGRWTVEMLLIFELGRPDVLPVDDLGIRKGFQKVYRLRALPDPEDIVAHAEAWRPWRSIGSWYLWRALDAER